MPYDPEEDSTPLSDEETKGRTLEQILEMKRSQELNYYTGMYNTKISKDMRLYIIKLKYILLIIWDN